MSGGAVGAVAHAGVEFASTEVPMDARTRRPPPILFATVALWLAMNVVFGFALLTARRDVFGWIGRVYDLNTLWTPPMFAAVGLTLWIGARRCGAPRPRRLGALALLALAVVLFAVRIDATYHEPEQLVVRHVTLATPHVVAPLRIVHISDIQADAIDAHEERVFATIRDLAPDLVIHTGDLLQVVPPATTLNAEALKLAALFETLHPPLGVFAVVGDVDGPMRNRLLRGWAGITTLEGREAVVGLPGGGRLRLYGLPLSLSRHAMGLRRVVGDWLARGEPGDLTILAGHAPDFAMFLDDLPVDLCLAGHTHGGQVRLPWFGPLMTLSDVPRDWARGFRAVGATHLNVSAGIGAEHYPALPPIRFLCPPELTVIDLVPEASGSTGRPTE